VEIDFPMPVRTVLASPEVKADIGKMAVQRGPVIYCAEWTDNIDGKVLNYVVGKNAVFTSEYSPSLLNGSVIIKTTGRTAARMLDGNIELSEEKPLTLIPYALWNNRGPGQMMVWLPTDKAVSKPTPAPTIAFRSKITASKRSRDLSSINDQFEPANSNDHTYSYYHWWPDKDSWQWVQYEFEKPETVSKTKIYWFDDGPAGGCRIPDEWKLFYKSGNNWVPVTAKTEYKVTKNNWDELEFKPIRTAGVRIMVKLNKDFASGIHEWMIE